MWESSFLLNQWSCHKRYWVAGFLGLWILFSWAAKNVLVRFCCTDCTSIKSNIMYKSIVFLYRLMDSLMICIAFSCILLGWALQCYKNVIGQEYVFLVVQLQHCNLNASSEMVKVRAINRFCAKDRFHSFRDHVSSTECLRWMASFYNFSMHLQYCATILWACWHSSPVLCLCKVLVHWFFCLGHEIWD